ncbi:MAG: FAD-dependent oxidoreductase [Patescibacteria group bacterium]
MIASQTIKQFRVVENHQESSQIFTLTLIPRSVEDTVTFRAGQWVFLHLYDEEGSTWKAPFSLANAPEESTDGRLELTIKIYKEFTLRASRLVADDIVGIQGPFGAFFPPENAKALVIFAGGIGITPFSSMVRSWARQADLGQETPKVTLFYSGRHEEDLLFMETFRRIAKTWADFTFVPTLTGEDAPSSWPSERGRIHREMVQKYVTDLSACSFLACGKQDFVEGIKLLLAHDDVDIKTRFKAEAFG